MRLLIDGMRESSMRNDGGLLYLVENINEDRNSVCYGVSFIGILDDFHWWEGYSIPVNYYNQNVFKWYNDNMKTWKVTLIGEL